MYIKEGRDLMSGKTEEERTIDLRANRSAVRCLPCNTNLNGQ